MVPVSTIFPGVSMSGDFRPLSVFLGTALGVLGMLAVVSDLAETQPQTDQQDLTLATAAVAENLDRRLEAEKTISLADLAGVGWQRVCLSRGAQPQPTGMQNCWPSVGETGLGGSFVNVVDAGGQCRQWRTVRNVIDKRFDDVVCLPGGEVPDLTLVLKAKVLDIE